MENLSIEKILCSIAIISCTIIIGYNIFHAPKVELVTFNVISSKLENEEYNPIIQSDTTNENSENLNANQNKKESQSSNYSIITNKLNINTATEQELSDNLDGVGEVLAKSIVEYREQNGEFKNIEELKNISGIGDKKFENIKDYIEIN